MEQMEVKNILRKHSWMSQLNTANCKTKGIKIKLKKKKKKNRKNEIISSLLFNNKDYNLKIWNYKYIINCLNLFLIYFYS